MSMRIDDDRAFFDDHQWRTIEAAMARIMPTDHEPGAREAGTVRFVDRYLSGIDYVYAQPDGTGFVQLEGKQATAWRQRIATLRARYVEGIEHLDRRSRALFGDDFSHLEPERQDRVLAGLETPDEAAADEVISSSAPARPAMQQSSAETDLDFFHLLVAHTRQGFYADPIYGGNADHVGWRVIGFPGPESLDDVHKGRYSTLPYFAPAPADQPGMGETR
ncbi:MAG: gluconate 2-dehydrogenase subunit 3 family protein [Chloroflexota bacterium]